MSKTQEEVTCETIYECIEEPHIHISQWVNDEGEELNLFSIYCVDCDKFIGYGSQMTKRKVAGGHKSWHTRNNR